MAKLDHIPGTYGWPLIGDTVWILRDPWSAEQSMKARYGPVFHSRSLGIDWVNLNSATLVGQALLDREQVLSSERGWAPILGHLFRRGLMLRDFEDHQRHRKIMQGAFREPARRSYHTLIERETARGVAGWSPTIDFYAAIKRTLIEQAATVFLGLELDAGLRERFVQSFAAMLTAALTPLHLDLPGTTWRRGLRARRWLAGLLAREAPRRVGSDAHDLFTQLCNTKDEQGNGFDADEAVDHAIFVLLAAHDTSATALSTLIDALVGDHDLQERLRDECRALGRGHEPASLDYDALERLELCDRAHREALRVNPPVPYILRSNIREVVVDGWTIPPDCNLSMSVRCAHADPTLWTDPTRFDPDRFAPDRAEHRTHPHAYMPFGTGAHRCLGAEFARQQGLTFIYHLLMRHRLRGERVQWLQLPIPRPRGRQLVTLEPV